MSRPIKLTKPEIAKRLKALPSWTLRRTKLHRKFQFPDFVAAFSWMTAIALVAEKMNHHPDWSNAYNRVEVDLSTHDAGGLTALDFELAHQMDRRHALYQ